ncbi:MAG: tRNA-dihydrouridine synthase [Myxococcota bacterium]
MAPIRGVTHAAFRNAFAKWFGGFDATLAPYMVAHGDTMPSDAHLRDAMPDSNVLPTVPQLLSDDPDAFVRVARVYLDGGCTEVNWNLGCPYPMVTRRRRGAGLLAHPDRVDAFLDHACSRLGACVSVKLRLGMHDAVESEPVIAVLNRYPLKSVTLHPRTASQVYRGSVDLDAFARCLQLSRHLLTYNGDIVDVPSFRERRSAFPAVRDWMLGRGAIANPFLPASLRCEQGVQQPDRKKLEGFHQDLLEHHRRTLSGSAHVLHKMKELWGYWARSFDPKTKAIKKILRAKRFEHYERHAREVFDGAGRWIR